MIKQYRLKNNLSQEALAEKNGISCRHLQRLEQNEENIWGLLLGTGYLKVTEVVDLAHGIYKV